MKYLFKIVALLLLTGIYSCKSPQKKAGEKKSNITDTSRQSSYNLQTADDEAISRKQDDSLSKPGNTKIIFPGYAIVMHNFNIYDRFDENGKLDYGLDPKEETFNSNKNRVVTLTMLQDTFHTSNNINNSFNQNQIEVIPQNKDDKFKIDFTIQLDVSGEDTTKSNKSDRQISWHGMTGYTPLVDSALYFFKVPANDLDGNFSRNYIKKQISARDTSVLYSDATIVYKNMPCFINENATYLRIQRERNGKLIDTKFIRIDSPYLD